MAVRFGLAKIGEAFIDVKRDGVAIGDAVFQFVAQIPGIELFLADGGVSTGADRNPLLVLEQAEGHAFGFIGVREIPFGGLKSRSTMRSAAKQSNTERY